ncbi:MAG: histidine kinase [Candidatus Sedimenticola endophacoides]|uniref:histidine kinase n=1 Tax=Candidatus Sedimenticola endophacoides TaxID=2548426 RepID=A0A6N4DNN8_9GAMM|nr:MAG: histidine kinase [Candidatus Sedimenticola endophacoides]PUE00353.1 MAG: histidine kinase [Candidatus Sedimenticola endophacoides]PUE03871.1 MAG: histidine kinase [Candidatus Sedimenticola endophacoides]
MFNQMSEQLVDSYHQLQQRVARLGEELAAARGERMVELAEKERLANRLSKLLDGLPAAVLLVDGAERIQQYNPAALQLFPGISAGECWERLLGGAVRADPLGKELRLENGRLVNLIQRSLTPEPGRILLLIDITETRELELRMERQERLSALGEMAAQLAHQIRTPLSSALLYTSHLGREDLSLAQRARFSGRCRERLLHMERQINDMLAFARGGSMRPERVGLVSLLTDLCHSIAPLFAARGATVECGGLERGELTICANPDALLGALSNLAINALEHGGEGVHLRIGLSAEGGEWVRIEFRDNGPGIPEAARARLFDPFFTTRTDGTGLGLAVVQSVVLDHHGAIELATSPSGGACFQLRFPIAAGECGGARRHEETAAP